ncbi:MAG: hydrolase [Bacteroidota bacterium]|nr:hydrolase [Bacteroidota bacterium]
MENFLRIAVDFDGTIVEHNYPEIGKPLPGAFDTLKALSEQGHKLILWTFRDGDSLQEAIEYCMENGVMFWTINKSFPEEEFNQYVSRKINADIYIDDKNFGGFPGWHTIYEKLVGGELQVKPEKKRGWFRL